MRMILVVLAVGLLTFTGIYFISNSDYEISIQKVDSQKTPPVTIQATNKTFATPQKPKLTPPKPFVLPTHIANKPFDASFTNGIPNVSKHRRELELIQKDLSHLHQPDGSIDIDRLEKTMKQFSALDKSAPELGIGKTVNIEKLQELVGSLRKLTKKH